MREVLPPQRTAERAGKAKKETLEDILSAVKDKENVVRPFNGERLKSKPFVDDLADTPLQLQPVQESKKETIRPATVKIPKQINETLAAANMQKMAECFASPLRYFMLKFGSGFSFVLGALSAVALILLGLYLTKDVTIIKGIFRQAVHIATLALRK